MRTPSSGSGPLTPTPQCSYIRLSRSNDGERMSTTGAFKDVIKRGREPERTLPVGEFIAQLDQFIAEHNPYRQSKVIRSEEHTSELQSPCNLVCRLLLEKKKKNNKTLHLCTK